MSAGFEYVHKLPPGLGVRGEALSGRLFERNTYERRRYSSVAGIVEGVRDARVMSSARVDENRGEVSWSELPRFLAAPGRAVVVRRLCTGHEVLVAELRPVLFRR